MENKNSQDTIEALVMKAQSGDEESLGLLYERLVDRIYRYLHLRVSHVQTAEDLTQTVFLEMIRSLPRYKVQTGAKFTTWLFQIARHRLIDHYRQPRSPLELEAAGEQADPAALEAMHDVGRAVAPGLESRLQQALRELPELQQTIIHLWYQAGLTAGEIGTVVGLTALSVRVHKHRALKKLRQYINISALSV